MLTLDRLRNAVVQATGLDAIPHGFNLVDVVNECQQMWAAEATWSYLDGRVYALPLVAAQAEYALPAYIGDVRDAWTGDPAFSRVRFMSPTDFERRKGQGASVMGNYPYATLRSKPDAASAGEARPHVELYPAPGAVGTLTIVYRAAAVRIEHDDESIDLPVPLEPAFLEYFRAYCRGSMLSERSLVLEMAQVRSSPMFRTALMSQMPHREVVAAPGNVGLLMALGEDNDLEYARRY